MSPDVVPPSDPKTGMRIGKYEILRRIGEGGMATIYLARSPGPGGFEKPVALKMLRPEFSQNQEASELLAREARVAAKLHHPNIVQVFDLGQVGPDYFMTMEWVDGTSLSRLLAFNAKRGQLLPVEVVAYVIEKVAEALDYIHQGVVVDETLHGLVHRDVSPSNVLISSSGDVKLTDFGIVKLLDAPTMTRDGVVKGKFAYMSPEQLRGEAIDHRSDIFSLGVVLYESLTARRLFYRKSLAATVAAVHAARVLPPSAINDNLPPELDQIALQALAKAPDDRFSEAGSLIAALQSFTQSGSRAAVAELVREVAEHMATPTLRGLPSFSGLPQLKTPPSMPDAVGTVLLPGQELPDTRVEDFQSLEDDLASTEAGGENYADALEAEMSMVRSQVRAIDRRLMSHQTSSVVPLPEPNGHQNAGLVWGVMLVIMTVGGIGLFWWLILH